MSWTKQELLDFWNDYINTNGVEAITGAIMNEGGVEIINALFANISPGMAALLVTTITELEAAIDRVNGPAQDLEAATIFVVGTIDISYLRFWNLNNIEIHGLQGGFDFGDTGVIVVEGGFPVFERLHFIGDVGDISTDNQRFLIMGEDTSTIIFRRCDFKNLVLRINEGDTQPTNMNIEIKAHNWDEMYFYECTVFTEGDLNKVMAGLAIDFIPSTGTFKLGISTCRRIEDFDDTLRYDIRNTGGGTPNLLLNIDASPIIMGYSDWTISNYIEAHTPVNYQANDEIMVNRAGELVKIEASELVGQGALGFVSFDYKFNTDLAPPNPAGDIKYNNTNPALVTEIYVNELDGLNRDRTLYIKELKAGDWLNIYKLQDADKHQKYDILATPVKTGNTYTISVAFYEQEGANFANNENITMYFRYVGAGGIEPGTEDGELLFWNGIEWTHIPIEDVSYDTATGKLTIGKWVFDGTDLNNLPTEIEGQIGNDSYPATISTTRITLKANRSALQAPENSILLGHNDNVIYRDENNVYSNLAYDRNSPNEILINWCGTQAAYDALTPDPNTMYFIIN